MANKPRGKLNDDEIFEPDYTPEPKKKPQPAYQVYEGSRIPVSKAWGKMNQQRHEAALKAYEDIYSAWDEVMRYYNNNQVSGDGTTPRGTFRRGDSSENLVFSNINVLLPAVYMKDPDFNIESDDEDDKPLIEALRQYVNVMFRQNRLNGKPKIKKAVAFGLLCNNGVLKLDFNQKDDSAERIMEELQSVGEEIKKAKNTEELEAAYGKLEALEEAMEVADPSGPRLVVRLPHHVLVDPYAEMPDGSDARWMNETVFLPTAYLNARYTKKDEDGNVYLYKPTHKAVFNVDAGKRDDGLGLVMEAINAGGSIPTAETNDERHNYIRMYMTECVYVWEKATRRVALFAKDDWSWPLWVWDDPQMTTRFYPFHFIAFSFSTGGMTSVGETSYYLDQQDEVNDINRQLARIRRTVFDYHFYNTNKIDPATAEKLIKALNGDTSVDQRVFGFALEEGQSIKDAFETLMPPAANYEGLFNKDQIKQAINGITNTSDALRGVQFKTNTNQKAVETYQDATRLSVGAKTDVVEDVAAEIAYDLCEWAVQNVTKEEMAGIIGKKRAEGYEQMSRAEFNTRITIRVVGGSMEKPNSIWRQKDALQVTQAVGQFAAGAPASSLMIMLKMLQRAFPDMSVSPEDWEALQKEMTANLTKGQSVEGAAGGGAAGGGGAGAGAGAQPDVEAMKNLPPEVKQKAMQMKQQGASDEEVVRFLQSQTQGGGEPQSQAA